MTAWFGWWSMPLAYLGQMGLPFLSMGGALLTMLMAGLGVLALPFKGFFKQFKKRGNRPWVLIGLVGAIGLGAAGWWMAANRTATSSARVLVLGLDGLDPNLLERFMDQNLLPNFQSLRKHGSYHRLATTNPALSPVAWSSFITGSNPGRHGLFDFLKRDPNTYLPDLALADTEEPKPLLKLGAFKLAFGQPRLKTQRKGTAFWDLTTQQRIPTVVLRTPVTFPPDKVHGRMLAGLGVPDLRGTQGTFAFYTTDSVETGRAMGGQIFHVKFGSDTIPSQIIGPRNTLTKPAADTTIPMMITVHRNNPHATIAFQGQSFDVPVGEWSEWKTLTFEFNRLTKVSGIVRFYLASVTPGFELYMSPINFDPRKPAFPISYPAAYAEELAEAIGLYHTIGQAEDTWSLNEGRVSDETFLEQCDRVIQEREAMLDYELARFHQGLLVTVFDTPDRIQHMFWRFQDPGHPLYDQRLAKHFEDVFPKLYQSMDRILGKVLQHVDGNTTLLVLSDHGFSQFRTAVHTNGWLKQQGYLAFKPTASTDPKDLHELFAGVEWSKTKLYAVGLAGIYFNKAGRERLGLVTEAEVPQLTEQVTKALLALKDPATGQRVVSKVFRKEEIYEGPYLNQAPDLVLGFEPGYRTSWQTALGATPSRVFEPNAKRWSGGHCVDPINVPGVLLVNRPINTEAPRIIDIAPTILTLFGIEPPESMDGRSLL